MGIAIFSRSPALEVMSTPHSRDSGLAAFSAAWRSLTTMFRANLPSPAGAALSGTSAIPWMLPGSTAPAQNHAAIKTVANHAIHAKAISQKQRQTVTRANTPRRLRVVRQVEEGISPSCAGRMVISGRMADVCAELDRMVQREAAAHCA